jgi:hypothetical protein
VQKYILIFLIGLIFGFSVLIFRNYYENKTGEVKSYWNVTELKDGDSKNFFDRGIALYLGKHYFAGCENVPIIAFFRPPVYPIFLALIFSVFGVSVKAVIIAQIILTSFIITLIALISNLIFKNNFISWLSGLLAVLYYPMWNDAMIINSELLSMLLGLVSLYFILKYFYSQKDSFKNLLLSGLFIGLSSLTRGQFFYYSILFLIFIFGNSVNCKKDKVNYSLLWFAFVLIPVLIWSVYAYSSSGVTIFISSQGPYSIWWGWSPLVVLEQKYPIWNPLWDKSFIVDDMIGSYLPAKSSMWFLNEAYSFIVKYPFDSFKIAYYKLLDSWGFFEIYGGKGLMPNLIKILKFNWDLFLAVPGWFLLWRQKNNKQFVLYVFYACILYTVISILTAGLIRYRVTFLDPFFIIFASYTIFTLYNHFVLKIKISKK